MSYNRGGRSRRSGGWPSSGEFEEPGRLNPDTAVFLDQRRKEKRKNKSPDTVAPVVAGAEANKDNKPDDEDENDLSQIKKERKERAEKFEAANKKIAESIRENRPTSERIIEVARNKNFPETFVFNEDNKILVMVKDSKGSYRTLGQALGLSKFNVEGDTEDFYREDGVRFVPGSTIKANLESKTVTIPFEITKKELPFIALEILRIANLDVQESRDIVGRVKKGKKWVDDNYTDYSESSASICFGKERKKAKAFRETKDRLRGEWDDRPFLTMRGEYEKSESEYLAARQTSNGRLNGLLSSAAKQFRQTMDFDLFSGWGGESAFDHERNFRLEKEQDEYVFRFDNKGNGKLTGYYTEDEPEAMGLSGTNVIPGVSLLRRIFTGENLKNFFGDSDKEAAPVNFSPLDPVRRANRVFLWDGSETVQNTRFRHEILHHYHEKGDGFVPWLKDRVTLLVPDAAKEVTMTSLKFVLGSLIAAGILPLKLSEKLGEFFEDKFEGVINWVLKKTSHSWAIPKESFKSKREAEKKWIENKAKSFRDKM
ncbi:MAG: hypothetical protein V1664_03705 [Candidatus Uhrbacteria bacterium]